MGKLNVRYGLIIRDQPSLESKMAGGSYMDIYNQPWITRALILAQVGLGHSDPRLPAGGFPNLSPGGSSFLGSLSA